MNQKLLSMDMTLTPIKFRENNIIQCNCMC